MSQSHRIRSDETWARARADYLAGDPAPVVRARYDLGESAFNKRARTEGWRRCDQPDPAVEPDEPLSPARMFADSELDCYDRADLALRCGRAAESERFLALASRYEALRRGDRPREEAIASRFLHAERTRLAEARREARGRTSAGVQAVQKVQCAAPPDPSETMATRATGDCTSATPDATPATPEATGATRDATQATPGLHSSDAAATPLHAVLAVRHGGGDVGD